MKRGRVFVNSVFHNMLGELDAISRSLFKGHFYKSLYRDLPHLPRDHSDTTSLLSYTIPIVSQ